MEDRSAASVGVALAGVALVAAALPWDAPGVGPVENAVLAALAAVALGAFSLRRRGLLARGPGALAAGIASLGVVGYVGLAVAGALGWKPPMSAGALAGGASHLSSSTPSPWVATLALAGGIGGVVAAYGDGRGFSDWAGRAARAVGWSLFVGFAGLFTMAVWAGVLVGLVSGLVPGAAEGGMLLVLNAVALGFGMGTVALVYFRWTDLTLSYLDVRRPTKRDAGYIVVGVVALFFLQWTLAILLQWLGVSTASHSVEQTAQGNPDILLLLIPASWLIIGPGEELLYRNIIQKSLYDTFGRWGAVLVGSVVFSLVHIPAYGAGASLPSLAVTLVVIFLLSLLLGATYLKTGNLVVSAVIHGTFDVIVFGLMYAQMTGMA